MNEQIKRRALEFKSAFEYLIIDDSVIYPAISSGIIAIELFLKSFLGETHYSQKSLGIDDLEDDLYLFEIVKLLHDQYFRLLDFYFHTLIKQRQQKTIITEVKALSEQGHQLVELFEKINNPLIKMLLKTEFNAKKLLNAESKKFNSFNETLEYFDCHEIFKYSRYPYEPKNTEVDINKIIHLMPILLETLLSTCVIYENYLRCHNLLKILDVETVSVE